MAPIAVTSPVCASEVTRRNPGQAAGDQIPQERQPAGAVLGGGDLESEDLPVPLGVDPGGDQGVDPDHPAGFADLEHQGVHRHERVRAGVQRPGAERLHLLIELAAITHTWDFDSRVMPSVPTSFSIRRVETPSR